MRFKDGAIACYIILTTAFVNGCSSRSVPAPVTLLNSEKPSQQDPFSQSTYTVQPGDTLFAVAWYSGNDYRDLARYNNLYAPYTIYPGQSLKLQAPAPPKRKVTTKSVKSRDTGLTTKNNRSNPVDQQKQQAYGESEKDVNNQPVKTSSNSSKKRFPARVSQWVWPAEGKLVARFSKAESGNKGIDIQAARGTPVVAAADGKVVYSGNALRGYGNLVIIKHSDNFLSAYAYNDTVKVTEQQWVKAGQQIATMGDSGTDSVKLHFEVRYKGKSLDPLRYLPQ